MCERVMDKKLFKNLVTSLKQARDISRGKRKASRVFTYEASGVKAILRSRRSVPLP